MLSFLLATGLFTAGCHAAPVVSPPPSRFAALGLPSLLSKTRLQALLQSFVDNGYGRSFRHLGDERDFDHGHLLMDSRTGMPIAILYHTQELAHETPASDFGYVDASARNWIQWLDGRGIVDARLYERASYPRSASWDWFVARELPQLRRRRTITEKMLDPERLGAALSGGVQWTFTRQDCGAAAADAASNVISVVLPDHTSVCLALGAS